MNMDSTKLPSLPNWWGEEDRRRAPHRDRTWGSPRIRIYAISEDDKQHLYEFLTTDDKSDIKTRMTLPTPVDPWLDGKPWRPVHSPDFKIYHNFVPVTSAPVTEKVPPMSTHHSSIWEAVIIGWVGGTLMLALFVFLVRAAMKFVDKKLFTSMRGQPGEVQTPDVLTTRNDAERGHGGQSDFLPERMSDVDLPPAYCVCASDVNIIKDGTKPPASSEDDPPSYSDCYVPVRSKGKLSSIYVFCSHEPRSDSLADINAVPVNRTALDVETVPENSNQVPDTVINSGEADISNGEVKDDAETQKADGIVIA